jgi:hypothetical protein
VRWPILLVIVALGLAFVYRLGPSRRKPQWRWITWGSVFAAITWVAVSILFSCYAENLGSYNKTSALCGGKVEGIDQQSVCGGDKKTRALAPPILFGVTADEVIEKE